MDKVVMLANILDLAKLNGKAGEKNTVVFTNFKELAGDHCMPDDYEKASNAIIVMAGVKRKLWQAGDWVAGPVNGVFCWTKEGQAPIPITLRAKKLPDGTKVENETSGDATHKNCVTYASAIKKALLAGLSLAELNEMGWSELVQWNAARNKDGSMKPEKEEMTPVQKCDKALKVFEDNVTSLDSVSKLSYQARLMTLFAV